MFSFGSFSCEKPFLPYLCFCIQYSIFFMNLPQALLDSLHTVQGFQLDSFVQVHQQAQAPTSIRLNPFKTSTFPAHLPLATPVPWCKTGYYLAERPSFTFDPLFHAGAYYVQEASSMFLALIFEQLFDANQALNVLDLCAAPGGKSTLVASLLNPASLLVSNEVIKSRAAVLVENLSKWGCTNTVVTNNDPSDFTRLAGYFDVMLVDAPCSGSGLFRRDPEAIAEWSPENVTLCYQRQQRILADAWDALKEGGTLIYSTCSYSKAENEDMLDWVTTQLGASSLNLARYGNIPLSDWGIVACESEKGAYGYRFFPDKVQGEGFFVAVFQKNNRPAKYVNFPRVKTQKTKTFREESAAFGSVVENLSDYAWFEKNGDYFLYNPTHEKDLHLLQKNLYLKKAGVMLGKLAGKTLVPEHELALSGVLSDNVPRLNVDYEEALAYLRRDDFMVASPTQGWQVVSYKDFALGWAKVLPNRINNYYPKEWRILSRPSA